MPQPYWLRQIIKMAAVQRLYFHSVIISFGKTWNTGEGEFN
jgi:hypothetical protein